MTTLSAAQQVRLEALLDLLLELPADQRADRLERESPDDSLVRSEIASLLRAATACGDFLSAPAQIGGESEPEDTLQPDALIGAWRIVRRIGRGGMGEVYEASRADGVFEQRAAVKVLQQGAVSQLRRFHAERQILARLEHPSIARLYDGGVTADGRPYMIMEFVEGQPITDHCDAKNADLETRLRLFMQICDAVAFAHRNLIVHRDLKPANILVDSPGHAKLLDFGVAKILDDPAARYTQTLAVPLTPNYAAPEQLKGDVITTATDVYALGLLLFELMAGTRPWMSASGSLAQLVRSTLERPAPLASQAAALNPFSPVAPGALRGDLDAIVARALRQEPAHRYRSVDALRLDVERTLRGDPVAARDGTRLYVIGRFLRRHRRTAAAAVMAVLSLTGGLVVATWQAHRAGVERDFARASLAREEAVRYAITGLFSKAITPHDGDTPTAKAMLDASAQRVLEEYRSQAQLAGPIVITLADLYDALEDPQGAAKLLDGYLSLNGAARDPAIQADARQKLANIELLRGDVPHAAMLLDQATTFWMQDPTRHKEERLEGLGVRARLQRAQGDLAGAIATQREAIAERTALSGHDHRETAILYNSLAISLTAADRLPEALAAYRETSAIYTGIGLGNGLDAQIVLGNIGTLELRTGHLREAEPLLKQAFERERALAGDSAAVAAAMGYYGRLLSVTGRVDAAIDALREAAALGARYTGEASPLSVQNRLFLGEALRQGGNLNEARETLSADCTAALKKFGPSHVLTLRAKLALAELDVASGRGTDARTAFNDIARALRGLGSSARPQLADALVALGDLDLQADDATDARTALLEAVALRGNFGENNWELAQARERLGESLVASDAPQARSLLQRANATLSAQLGNNHVETIRARQALGRLTL
jgi:eukaryotic-like serine/threonine-protein kinase